jgi:hypothetical protein
LAAVTQGLCVIILSSKGFLSLLSDSTEGFSPGRRYTAHVGSGTAVHDISAASGADRFPAAQRTKSDRLRGSAAFLHGNASGRNN